jgi:hypothetical protein
LKCLQLKVENSLNTNKKIQSPTCRRAAGN